VPGPGLLAEDDMERAFLPLSRSSMAEETMKACRLMPERERDDDPVGNARVGQTVQEYETTILHVMQAPDVGTARRLVRDFADSARGRAADPWERSHARRLELSAELSVLLRFHGRVEEAAALGAELVVLPCHRRMAQLWEMIVIAGYCRDQGRPDAAWPHLVRALRIVETEIPTNVDWLADRARFRNILAELWAAMSPETRDTLEPYAPPLDEE
jgi:hypothetical protein